MHNPLRINLQRQRRLLADALQCPVPEISRVQDFLAYLSNLLASPPHTMLVASLFRPLLPDLAARFLEMSIPAEDHLTSLCLLLEIHPELYPILHQLLQRHPFQKGILMPLEDSTVQKSRLHKLLLIYYRILQANRQLPTLFLWSPHPLCCVIANKDFDNASRLLAIRCYSLHILLSENEREKLEAETFGELFGPDCPLEFEYLLNGTMKLVDGWLLPLLEEKRIHTERSRIAQHPMDFYDVDDFPFVQIQDSDLSPYTANIHGIFLCREPIIVGSTCLVPTASAIKGLQSIALHLACDLPILLTSPPSSGKSILVSHLARVLHSSSENHVLTIHLADTSLDPRSLLGSYVSSTASSGSFEWKEGVLVRAMREGKWLLLKDIDKASPEVLGVLKPLVASLHLGKWIGGRGEIDTPNRGRVVAAYGFSLFATRSILPGTNGSYPAPHFFGSHKFFEVTIEPPVSQDLVQIIESKFPSLQGIPATGLIQLWEAARSIPSSSSAREIGIRDLEKLCQRVTRVVLTSHISQDVDMDVSLPLVASFPNIAIREAIFLEARDVLFGCGATNAATQSRLNALADVVAQHLGFDMDRMRFLLSDRVPEFLVEKDTKGGNIGVVTGFTRLPATPWNRLDGALTPSRPFALHRPAIVLLSRIIAAISQAEPILLTGETGTGKTTTVSHLATLLNRPLISLNLSQQTEASDLLGGFKPVEARVPGGSLQVEFLSLFGSTFSRRKNEKFEGEVRKAVTEGKWKRVVKLWKESIRLARERLQKRDEMNDHLHGTPRKRRKTEQDTPAVTETMWSEFEKKVDQFEVQHIQGQGRFAFDFTEGPLVQAVRSGNWVLLDEINLATRETLECITSLLHSPTSSITLTEQGLLVPVSRHPDFRLLACMNPATDVGKKDLAPNIRSLFTEIDVPAPDSDKDTLLGIISQYIGVHATGDKSIVLDIAEFYVAVKQLSAQRTIADGSNQRPHFSLRTLTRALTFTSDTAPTFGLRRALWEGCIMAFTMVLDRRSEVDVMVLARKHLLADVKNPDSLLSRVPLPPPTPDDYINISPFYLKKGPLQPEPLDHYIVTPSVRTKLTNLSRIILTQRFPVLIEGPTSAGKTSAIEYLAKRTGHRFVRINNHEHTDLQEYVGSYVSDTVTGKLVFKDGLLVRALRRGDWIVLDELNLAPTDVLEALNRLLDDNRELVIPETGEVVRPHPHFMLFATQNPPGLYAGRKVLSRAFRNRFLEVHFDDVPQDELTAILHERCRIAPSYAQRIVRVFSELQKRRESSRVFESRHGFATLRDLFRWASREAVGYQQLAENGYMLLAERARRTDDKVAVKEVIESVLNVRLDVEKLYDFERLSQSAEEFLGCAIPQLPTVVWTKAMKRLFILLSRALRYNEPVLLVGETGSGKTSVCQVFADASNQHLRQLNCHQNTETADILGGLRPVRNRTARFQSIFDDALVLFQDLGLQERISSVPELSSAISQLLKDPQIPSVALSQLTSLSQRIINTQALFEWQDGPLLQSMKQGEVFLLDEISLADDSVLERLNSVLETARTIVLAEKGGQEGDAAIVSAQDGFQLVATMNPGGDYGKKELSPALRNRFTEIWVPSVEGREDLTMIVNSSWKHEDLKSFTSTLLEFVDWLRAAVGDMSLVTLRDILTFVQFCNTVASSFSLSLPEIFHHAAHMTFIDGLSTVPQVSSYSDNQLHDLVARALGQLQRLVPIASSPEIALVADNPKGLQIGPFSIPFGVKTRTPQPLNLTAPTTGLNSMRVIRAFQVSKPILLEGSPGVGKTSLVSALASISGHEMYRINLSDQTDLSDLFGSDLPTEGSHAGQFAWRDGEFLRAMQDGKWVLLDEMNLASQSVLEGLNAVLDHRGTVFIPELGCSFTKHPDFRLFAAQNPLSQGGGRKGLPKSFVNRFTRVYIDQLSSNDMILICQHSFPSLEPTLINLMVEFNAALHREVSVRRSFGRSGAPWEFNLRDLMRWCTLLDRVPDHHPIDFLWSVYLCRFRDRTDRLAVRALFGKIFEMDVSFLDCNPKQAWSSSGLSVGHANIPPGTSISFSRIPSPPPSAHFALEALMDSIHESVPSILCGPSYSGKNSALRSLADGSGNPLKELHLSAGTDAADMLGGFEQNTGAVALHQLVHQLRDDLKALLNHPGFLQLTPAQWDAIALLRSPSVLQMEKPALLHALDALSAVTPHQVADIVRLVTAKQASAPSFLWIDGPLVDSLKRGTWLVLDSANTCNASVLDRLNSLCEPGGTLTLNERGFVDGGIPLLKPHPNFRLFMTIDPQYGELSRAMRNRSTEISFSSSTDGEGQSSSFYRLLHLTHSPLPRAFTDSASYRRCVSQVHVDTPGFLPFLTLDHRLEAVNQRLSILPRNAGARASAAFLFHTVSPHNILLFSRLLSLNEPPASLKKALKWLLHCQAYLREIHSRLGISLGEIQYLHSQSMDVALTSVPRSRGRLLSVFKTLHQHIFHLGRVFASFITTQNSLSPVSQEALTPDHLKVVNEIATLLSAVPSDLDFYLSNDTNLPQTARVLLLISELPGTLSVNCVDYSALRVLLSSLTDNLNAPESAVALNFLRGHVNILSNLMRLQQGTGLFEIWASCSKPLLAQATRDATGKTVSSQHPWSIELRRSALDLLSVQYRPLVDQAPFYLTEPSPISSTTWNGWNLAVFAILGSILCPQNITTPQPLARLLDIGCLHPTLPIRTMIPVRRLHWSLDSGKDLEFFVSELLLEWMNSIWSDPLTGAAVLFHPVQLRTCSSMRTWSAVSLADISTHEQELQFQARLTRLESEITFSRKETLLHILAFSLEWLFSWFGYNHSLKDPTPFPALLKQLQGFFHPSFPSHLQVSLLTIFQNAEIGPLASLQGIAHCFVGLSHVVLDLYLPSLPIDPAACDAYERDFTIRLATSLEEELTIHTTLERSAVGNTTNETIEELQGELATTLHRVALHPPTNVASRGTLSTQAFWGEVGQFRKQVIPPSRTDSLFDTLSRETPDFTSRELVVQDSIDKFMHRLHTAYPEFKDLTRPIDIALHLMKIGLRVFSAEYGQEGTPAPDSASLHCALVTFPMVGAAERITSPESSLLRSDSSPFEVVILHLSALVVCNSFSPSISRDDHIHRLLASAYDLWNKERARVASAEQNAQALYRSKSLDRQSQDDALQVEEELRTLFPLYDDLFDSDNSQVPSPVTSAQHSRLVRIHKAITTQPSLSPTSEAPLLFDSSRRHILASYTEEEYGKMSAELDSLSVLHRIHGYRQALGELSHAPESNFYLGQNVPEVRKAAALIGSMRQRLASLVQEWPDQLVLSHLLGFCDELLSLKVDSPVAKVLSGLEQLLAKTDDWEAYANRENSLRHHRSALTEQIVAWRQLELSCWKGLLDDQAHEYALGAHEWWFRLYELTILGPADCAQRATDEDDPLAKYLDDLPPLLREFVHVSSMGQLGARLELLDTFHQYSSQLAKTHPSLSRVPSILRLVHSEFVTFNEAVSNSIKTQREPLEREVTDFIKLASWKDVNVQALRQSSKKSHHQLYKVIRKFRDVLKQPASPHFSPSPATPQEIVHSPDVLPLINYVGSVHPPSAAHNQQTFFKFVDFVTTSIADTLDQYTGNPVEQLSVEIIATATRLAKEPLGEGLSKEKRSKNAKSLLQRKRKAFSDLLKELKRAGLPANIPPQILANHQNPRWISEHLRIDYSTFPDIGRYPARLHSLLPQLRMCIYNHHSDLSTRDFQRIILFIEAVLEMGIVAQSRFLEISKTFEKVQDVHQRISTLQNAFKTHFFSGDEVFHRAEVVLGLLNGLVHSFQEIEEGLASCQAISPSGTTESISSKIVEARRSTEAITEKITPLLDVLAATSTPIASQDEYDTIRAAECHLVTSVEFLRSWGNNEPSAVFLLSPVADWLEPHTQQFTTLARHSKQLPDLSPLLNTFLVSVQQLLAVHDLNKTSPVDDDRYIQNTQSSLLAISRAINVQHVYAHFDALAIGICLAPDPRKEKTALLDAINPFVTVYLAVMRQHVDALSRWTSALFKLGYVLSSVALTIARDGFCQPPDVGDDDDERAAGKAELDDGVGLGAGSGTKNVSNEIEEEGQVEGLRGEEDDEESNPEENNNDENAIEMENDVGGALEDVKGEDDAGSQKSDDGDEGPEDRREDLDPSDPNAVDEKLWGDESSSKDDSRPDQTTSDDRSKQQTGGESEVVAKEMEGKKSEADLKEMAQDEKAFGEGEIEDLPDETEPNEAGAQMDEQVPDANTLDLPDDMNLDSKEDSSEIDAEDDISMEGVDENVEADGELDTTEEPQGRDMEETDGPDNDFAEDVQMHQLDEGTPDAPPHEEEGHDHGVAPQDVPTGQGYSDEHFSGMEEQQGQGSSGVMETARSAKSSQEVGNEQMPKPPEGSNETPSPPSGTSSREPQQPANDAENSGGAHGQQPGELEPEQSYFEKSPNPLRSLGDAMRDIQQRFDEILESERAKENLGDIENPSQLEYLRPEEENHEMEALGPADNNPQAKLQDINITEPPDEEANDPELNVEPQQLRDNLAPRASLLPLLLDSKEERGANVRPQDGVQFGESRNSPDTEDASNLTTKGSHLVDDEAVEDELRKWQSSEHTEESTEKLWTLYSSQTQDLAYSLCEQLRLILEPTRATRLKGDYRSGKRLNMKKVISYIASDYTKDKIWLRRTRPSQREYQILIALDDSRSMAESHSIHLSYQTLALVTKALDRLEAGDVAIAKFGEKMEMLHTFEDGQFTDRAGAEVIEAFRFDQKATNVFKLVEQSLGFLEKAREKQAMSSSSSGDLWQLEVIISDGICQDHERLRTVLRQAAEQKVMIVFIVIDSLHHAGGNGIEDNSILSMEKAEFTNVGGKMELELKRYMDSFPFEYYVVLRNMEALPEVLSGTLRQFFERISEE